MEINMSITSFYFLCFYGLLLLLYYVLPGKVQRLVLLGGGAVFYLLSGQGILLFYPLVTGGICFAGGRMIEKAGQPGERRQRIGLLLALAGALGPLVVLKYTNFFINTASAAAEAFRAEPFDMVNFVTPLGISYYTFTMLSYVIDLYYGTGKSASHFGTFLLHGTYFPSLISGPISSFGTMQQQYEAVHRFDYIQVTRGMQRMVWGFFKKLVISQRMAVIVNAIADEYERFQGSVFWLFAVCFVLQLYTDFSGCMDIVLGLSETFGLKLPENFNTPFFSESIAEFWRRWHITLGTWMKNYVFYPLLRSKVFTELGNKLRKRLGKKKGKRLTTFLGMFVLWFTVGIWHGPDWKYVLGSGLIHWAYIVLGEISEPWNQKIKAALHLKDDNMGFRVFRRVRTFLLVALAFVFFRAPSLESGCYMIKSMFTVWNPGAVFGAAVFELGLDPVEMVIAVVSLLLLLVVSCLQNRGIRIRESIAAKKLPVRWLIWYALLFYVILLGYYGPGYSAAEFIYQGF